MTALRAVAAPLDAERARALTESIRERLREALDLLADAWEARIWEALGHPSWEAYLDAEVPEVKLLKLPVPERRKAVAAYAARGMSQAAMAPALNVSAGTVNNDVRQAVPADADAVVVSLDGRRRKARVVREVAPPAPKPTRTDEALALVRAAGPTGLTSVELGKRTGWPEGLPSGTLCRLERRGLVRRLPERRESRSPYVLA